MKKCVKIRVILFKNYKYVFKHVYQIAPYFQSSISVLATILVLTISIHYVSYPSSSLKH